MSLPPVSELAADCKITWRTLPLTDPLVAEFLKMQMTPFGRNVMLHERSRRTRGSHFRLRQDKNGYYIRRFKRGQGRAYLKDCEITFLNGKPTLFQFNLTEPT